MSRKYTSLPHDEAYYGSQWNGKIGNYDPGRKPITTIVLHSTAGFLAPSIRRLSTPTEKVSCHYVVNTNGKITAMVPEDLVAYHSGNYLINQESIGIEFVDNKDVANSRTDSLYKAGAKLIADISNFYNLPLNTQFIKLHSEIVATSCPNGLDRDRLIKEAIAVLNPPEPIHNYQMTESVFVGMVTKATNLDNLLKALELNPSLGAEPDSYKQVLAHMQNFINAEVAKRAPVTSAPQSPTDTSSNQTPLNQSKSIWKKDVLQVLKDILNSIKGGKTK